MTSSTQEGSQVQTPSLEEDSHVQRWSPSQGPEEGGHQGCVSPADLPAFLLCPHCSQMAMCITTPNPPCEVSGVTDPFYREANQAQEAKYLAHGQT